MDNNVVLSSAPSDIILDAEADKRSEVHRRQLLEIEGIKAEEARKLLQKNIYDNSNPSPLFMAIIVLTVLFCLYFVYILFIKPSMTGEWTDISGNIWYIVHNKLTGTLEIEINGYPKGEGQIIGNLVEYGELTGIWNNANTVVFTEGWSLERIGA